MCEKGAPREMFWNTSVVVAIDVRASVVISE